jgi:hypothetical protein
MRVDKEGVRRGEIANGERKREYLLFCPSM